MSTSGQFFGPENWRLWPRRGEQPRPGILLPPEPAIPRSLDLPDPDLAWGYLRRHIQDDEGLLSGGIVKLQLPRYIKKRMADIAAAHRRWREEHPAEHAASLVKAARATHKKRQIFHKKYPGSESSERRIRWFEEEFLHMAAQDAPMKGKGEWLKLAFMCVLKGEQAGGGKDVVMDQYRAQLQRAVAKGEAEDE
jgi:hypothetical protein